MIYKLRPNRVGRTYVGGGRIDRFTGYPLETSVNMPHPEDWLASAITVVNEGVTEGMGMTEEGISVPSILHDEVLPILLKLLDSDERLVIQAHPTPEFAKKNLNSDFGKTECWYILDCTEDACVYLGFQEGVTKEKWREAILRQNKDEMLSMLCRIPVTKGDFIFVDGGMPHAIGAGCFLAELQEPSDLMVVAEKYTPSGRKMPEYRFDMNMGFEKALDLYDYTTFNLQSLKNKYFTHPELKPNDSVQILGESLTDKFAMYALCGNACHQTNRKYSIAIITNGVGTIGGKAAKKGESFLITSEAIIETQGDTNFTVILCE